MAGNHSIKFARDGYKSWFDVTVLILAHLLGNQPLRLAVRQINYPGALHGGKHCALAVGGNT